MNNTQKHHWNTRRCIMYKRYLTQKQMYTTIRFVPKYASPLYHRIQCPHCNSLHFVFTWRGMADALRLIAELPPLYPVWQANPLRSNGSTARK